MSEQRFFCKVNEKGRNIIVDKDCHYRIKDMYRACDYLNRLDLKLKTYNEQIDEQQATIEMYQRRIDKREEQISIIKKHCLKFLTNEQFETIKKELENE